MRYQPQRRPVRTDYSDRRAYLENGTVHIYFQQSEEVVLAIKHIYERRCVEGRRKQHWKAPLTLDAVWKLKEAHFTFDERLEQWERDIFTKPKLRPDFEVPGLPQPLFPYQKDAVQMLDWWDGNALLADDQGLGKTPEVLAWLHLRQKLRPVLVVCPANLKANWETEIEFWLPGTRVQIISGNAPTQMWGEIVIVNYDILSQVKDGRDVLRRDIWSVPWKVVILDEAHYIGNSETIRCWAVQEICRNVPHVIPITATPGRNRPKDLYTLINLVDDRIFPSFYKYAHRYCGARKGYKGIWEFRGSSNEKELHHILTHTMMIRRKKQDVFKDLSRKVRVALPFELDNWREYQEADLNFDNWLENQKRSDYTLTYYKIETLKQLALRGKIKACIEWIRDMLETEDKLVVFAEHKDTINQIMKAFPDISVKVDGSTSDKKREEAKHAFQRCARCDVRKEKHDFDKRACPEYVPDLRTRLYVGSSAAKEGNTLTASEHVVFLEFWWSPKDHDQAEDRCYGRAGDLHGATAWYLFARGTIEEFIAKVLDIKNVMLDKVLDGRDLTREEMLTELIKAKRKERRK